MPRLHASESRGAIGLSLELLIPRLRCGNCTAGGGCLAAKDLARNCFGKK